MNALFTMPGAPPRLRFTADDGNKAHDEWGANCGPGALAAIAGLTLDEVRPHMGDFERKRYTNPTLMLAALKSLGIKFEEHKLGWKGSGETTALGWPAFGLARIQWEGPWTKPGVPVRARYRYTHWVGSCILKRGDQRETGVFDINCINNGTGWVSLENWRRLVVPNLVALYPRADGKWHITHALWIER